MQAFGTELCSGSQASRPLFPQIQYICLPGATMTAPRTGGLDNESSQYCGLMSKAKVSAQWVFLHLVGEYLRPALMTSWGMWRSYFFPDEVSLCSPGWSQTQIHLPLLPECWDQRCTPSQLMIFYSSKVWFIFLQSVQLICLVL